MKRKYFIYNRLNVFGTLLLTTLLPCFLATLFLGVVFLPMMNKTAANSDEALAQVIVDAVANHFDDVYAATGELTAAVEHSSWIHSTYLDMLNNKMPASAVRVEITNALNKACVRTGAKSLSFKFYDSSMLYNNRGVVDDLDRYRDTYQNNIQYLFYSSDTQEECFSTVSFDGVEYLLYQCPFRDIEGGRYKGEINILFQSAHIGAKLINSIDGVAACRLTDLEGNSLWEYTTNLYNEETVTLSRLSQNGDIYYCVDIPLSVYNKTQSTVFQSMVVTLIVSLAISALLSYVLSRATYRPIQQIVWKFVGKDLEANNDFEELERVFDRVLLEKSEIETTLDQLRPIARQKILGALLDGTAFLADSVEKQLDYCHIRFDYDRLNVVTLEMPFSQLQETEIELTAELAMEALLERLSNQLPVKSYLYYRDSDHYQVLLNYQSWDQLQSYISLLTANCRQYFQKHTLGEGIYFGVGQVVFSVEEIYRAAEQAETAINVAALNRLEQPMFYSEVAAELNYDYFYPMSEEMLISRAISNCNTQTARELLHDIIEENRLRPQLNPKCMWLLYMDLCSTVARSGQSLGITLAPQDMKESYITLDEVELRVGNIIDDICQQIIARRQKSMNAAELEILNYIDEHIYDPDLSLNGVADRFNKSSTYISLLFKERRGIYYNTYINKARIMRAVQLMSDQNLDSNTVYPMVGYVSLSTFRRNFTKYAKSNPGDGSR